MPVEAVLLVYSNPPSGQEEECARYYDTIHIPDMLTLEGVVGARRMELEDAGVRQVGRDGQTAVARWLTIYELGTRDIAAVRAAIGVHLPQWKAAGRSFDGMQVVSSAAYLVSTGGG
jgi:hypothetical protein